MWQLENSQQSLTSENIAETINLNVMHDGMKKERRGEAIIADTSKLPRNTTHGMFTIPISQSRVYITSQTN
jgi:hypothetical protein